MGTVLLLALKRHENFVIGRPDGSRTIVSLSEIRGDRAKIGIEADDDTAIYRQTILNTMSHEEQDRILRAGRAKP
jgi:sRNA-binding carbon storage regulator CsrA